MTIHIAITYNERRAIEHAKEKFEQIVADKEKHRIKDKEYYEARMTMQNLRSIHARINQIVL